MSATGTLGGFRIAFKHAPDAGVTARRIDSPRASDCGGWMRTIKRLGEVSERSVDPGAYVRPGNAVVTIVDRTTVRVTADAPESDFAVVAPGTQVRIESASKGARLTPV